MYILQIILYVGECKKTGKKTAQGQRKNSRKTLILRVLLELNPARVFTKVWCTERLPNL